jgi:outer membrane protein TolC
MRRWLPIWNVHASLPWCASVLAIYLAGCHSIELGPMLAGDEASVIRARLGNPTSAQVPAPILPTAHLQEKPSQPEVMQVSPSDTQPIDLASALARGGADNPTIALADEAVRTSLAERTQARALLFPTLDAGANLRIHRGNLLSGGGTILDVNTQSLYGGFGAGAIGGRTVAVPGIRLVGHLADAVYAPQAAQQKVVKSQLDARATRAYLLSEVGVRYLALVEAQAQREAYRQSLLEFAEIERLTTNHAKAGQGREADAHRARSEALLLRAQAQSAEEAIAVAAAELAQLLDTDPALPLRSIDPTPPLLEFAQHDQPLADLLEIAIANHPEVGARMADVAFHEIRLKQERIRPLLPVIAVGFSAGEFGGGGPTTTSRLGSFAPRTDLDVVAVWSLNNAGVGNRAVQNVARSNLESALIERAAVLDRIRREVIEAHTQVHTFRQEMELARKRTELSHRAYTQEMERARNLKALPIEVLRSARQLADARQALIRAMSGYSQAQLRLVAALGNPPAVAER